MADHGRVVVDLAWEDRETAWIHLSENELHALAARAVPESVRLKAQELRLGVLEERMRENARKALAPKQYRRRRTVGA